MGEDFWITIISSSVIAAIISCITSVIIAHQKYKQEINKDRYNKKWNLSLEAFKNLQDALADLDSKMVFQKTDDNEKDIEASLDAMFTYSVKKNEIIKSVLCKVSYLIPQDKLSYLNDKVSELELLHQSLLASVYQSSGIELPEKFANITFPESELITNMKKYIDKTSFLSDELKNEITIVLRKLSGT